jgi:hypothetical protein
MLMCQSYAYGSHDNLRSDFLHLLVDHFDPAIFDDGPKVIAISADLVIRGKLTTMWSENVVISGRS